MKECDQDALIRRIRQAVRQESRAAEHYSRSSQLPVSADLDAELLLIGAALYGKRTAGVEPAHFYSVAHRELWVVAVQGGTWVDVMRRLTGDQTAIDVLYERLRVFEYTTTEERADAAALVIELAARRELRSMMERLCIELAYGHAEAEDAERELQQFVVRGYQ